MLRLNRMKMGLRKFVTLPILMAMLAMVCPPRAGAYSVLSHEEIVDMAWKVQIVPMLKARFPDMTDDDMRQAHAYAYGGSVIQDIGYYPFGDKYFSDLVHYVRANEFVDALIRDSTTPDEYAFALGALAHFCGDTVGHPAINQVVSEENPPLRHKFGGQVTYAQDPTAHLRTEFGFDVVEVAQGHYSQENYRDFIGFQVAKPLLNQAFEETYGIPVSDVLKHEDLAISTYRQSVSHLIPRMTTIAFVHYKSQIEQATPGIEKRKFLYRLNQTEYKKEFGTDYYHVGIRGKIVAFFLQLVPKVGPFKALKVTLPNAQEQDIYIKSVNSTVDRYRHYLAQIHAAPAPLPPSDPKAAALARQAAEKVAKDVDTARRLADEEQDPAEKASLERVAVNVAKTSELANAAADRADAKVAVDEAVRLGLVPAAVVAVPVDTPIQPPSRVRLPELDLDTGEPSRKGEYPLADKTYARLLEELTKPSSGPAKAVDVWLARDIERFFGQRMGRPGGNTGVVEAQPDKKVADDLARLQAMAAPMLRQGQP